MTASKSCFQANLVPRLLVARYGLLSLVMPVTEAAASWQVIVGAATSPALGPCSFITSQSRTRIDLDMAHKCRAPK